MKASAVLVALGIVLAAGLGFAAHVVAQDTIGLPAVTLEGGRPLAPEEARPATTVETETETETERETETRTDSSGPGSADSGSEDDDSGRGRGRGRGRGGDD
ncbi:MAG TPA: hypothetical protein VML35_08485 [Gaiellaceae bacterium]|nr:hypothetical protein [Gaiellaceae bacterium]